MRTANMAKPTGRAVKSNRGIGSGTKSAQVSTGKAAKSVVPGAPKGEGIGGNTKPVSVPKDRQPKNMGRSGEKKAGPKYGRDKGSKTY